MTQIKFMQQVQDIFFKKDNYRISIRHQEHHNYHFIVPNIGLPDSKIAMAATKIETFIFLDIEGSGFEASNEIVELAMVAVHRQAMKTNGDIPRVVDKLVLCVDPGVEVSTIGINREFEIYALYVNGNTLRIQLRKPKLSRHSRCRAGLTCT